MTFPTARLAHLRQDYARQLRPGLPALGGPALDFMLMRRAFMSNSVLSLREARWLAEQLSPHRIELMTAAEREELLRIAPGMLETARRLARDPKAILALERLEASVRAMSRG